MTGTFTLPPLARTAHAVIHAAGLLPASLVPIAPALSALDAPLTLDGEVDLGTGLALVKIRAKAHSGAGAFKAEGGAVPFRSIDFTLSGTPDHLALEQGHRVVGSGVAVVNEGAGQRRHAGSLEPGLLPACVRLAA